MSAVWVLASCAQLQHKQIVKPMSDVEIPPPKPRVANGSIYQASTGYHPLFQDMRPRAPGDVLTIVFNEDVSATKQSKSNANRDSSMSFTPAILPKGLERLGDYQTDIKGGQTFDGGGGSSAKNTFTGTITVRVVQVMSNGNLRVHGEKQIGINQGAEYIRFAGIVDPRVIGSNNSVQSSQVANAKIEYVGEGYIDEAQHMGWLQRILLKIWPF